MFIKYSYASHNNVIRDKEVIEVKRTVAIKFPSTFYFPLCIISLKALRHVVKLFEDHLERTREQNGVVKW